MKKTPKDQWLYTQVQLGGKSLWQVDWNVIY